MENIDQQSVLSKNAGTVEISKEESGIKLYEHQKDAFAAMTKRIIGKYPYKGLLVLPTGGGKTLTAARWIAENIIDKGIKVLWIAHRHELLEQAKRSFTDLLAFKDVFKNKEKFNYRIVSGIHDMAVNIKHDDSIVFASKDSIRSTKSFEFLRKNWLEGEKELFFVIDEAHHAPAKTYRKLIERLENSVPNFRMLGLTATPIRTSNNEEGYLAKIFPDDMVYNVNLKSLITLGILSEPIFENEETHIDLAKDLSDEEIKKIGEGFDLDSIGGDVAKKIADNNERNNLIVNSYIKNKDKYNKTIVFAINKENVLALNALFREKGIRSDYVMSDTLDATGRHSISSKENKDKIQRFRKGGDIDVLINVNILTEGTDVPDVQSVFLTRPTHSKILMTQMMGRALRGERAGGTKEAYVVTFIDDWNNKIAWVNPEQLYISDCDFDDLEEETRKRITRLIAISKIEEFAILNDKIIDPDKKALLESIDFIDRIPKGVYKFSYQTHDAEGTPTEKTCEILVYDNLEKAYRAAVDDIPLRLADTRNQIEDPEEITAEQVINITDSIVSDFFYDVELYPAYRVEDIDDLVCYYFQTGQIPTYYEFKDREKYNIKEIAQYIINERLDSIAEKEYIDEKWASEQGGWQTFFDYSIKNFRREILLAKERILNPEDYVVEKPKPRVFQEEVKYEDMSLIEIRAVDPEYERWLRNMVFEKYTDKDGFYYSAKSNFKSKKRDSFEIDHIKPRSYGGKTVLENLQLLTWWENKKKGDSWEPGTDGSLLPTDDEKKNE